MPRAKINSTPLTTREKATRTSSKLQNSLAGESIAEEVSSRLKSQDAEAVYTWTFRSSQPRGGKIITYLTQLNSDGSISCDCAGWVMHATRACWHVGAERGVLNEAKQKYQEWKTDQTSSWEVENVGATTAQAAPEVRSSPVSPTVPVDTVRKSKAKYGRVISF